jgi:hypothetical protein
VAKDREARYSNLAEFAEALRPFASEEGQESIARIAKALGRRAARSLPPPLPGAPRSSAIVHVARPAAKKAPAVALPVNTRRWGELALTAAGLAAAGALGVFFAVHTMEGALAAAIAPRAVVADLSPALPASAAPLVLVAPPPAGVVAAVPHVLAAPQVAALPVAGPISAVPAPASPAVATRAVRAVAPTAVRPPVASAAPVERAIVADANTAANPPARTTGLFDDAN